ncbi:MAG TPA: hypothetical protein VHJ39_10315 [Solirubrobacteraceae bacterium]|jgi:hypothetical protein|nr:hypothetical protein [Solirubrobacteraceae bacterium]
MDDARTIASAVATGRIAIGVAVILLPGRVATAWIGPRGADPGARLLAVAVGARDLAVGAGTAVALREGSGARNWVLAGAVADFADLAATLRYRSSLPRLAAVGVAAVAAAGGLAGLWSASRLD